MNIENYFFLKFIFLFFSIFYFLIYLFNNLILNIFCLLVLYILTSFLFFFFNFEFFGFLHLIIYAGAIVILFIYIIMLVSLKKFNNVDTPKILLKNFKKGFLIFLLFSMFTLYFMFWTNFNNFLFNDYLIEYLFTNFNQEENKLKLIIFLNFLKLYYSYYYYYLYFEIGKYSILTSLGSLLYISNWIETLLIGLMIFLVSFGLISFFLNDTHKYCQEKLKNKAT